MNSEQLQKIFTWHNSLMKDENNLEFLSKIKAISRESVINHDIGYDKNTGEFTLPVKDHEDFYIDIFRFPADDTTDWLENIGKRFKRISIQDSIKAIFHGKNMCFTGITIGKDLSPYHIPSRIEIFCKEARSKDKCSFCMLCKSSENSKIEYFFKPTSDKSIVLEFVGASNQQINGTIRNFFRIPRYNTCRNVEIDIVERQDVTEAVVIGEIDYEQIDVEYVVQRCFFFNTPVKTNQQYDYYGTTWNDPKTQAGIHIITNAKSSQDSLSKWSNNMETHEKLKIFQPYDSNDVASIEQKLGDIFVDLTYNLTKMYKRYDIIMATDLVYHSVTQFKFLGNMVNKGWAECVIIGDTRTGKSETVKNIVKHYKAGEFVTSGENTTLAGILGGVQQTHQNRWSLTWGKIPLNDKRLVALDEADELGEKGIIGKLSGVRSSGIAEIIKIQTQRTMARTRLIFIVNPRNGKVSEYSYGIETIRDVFEKNQDISRLDFAIVISKDDVDSEEINRIHNKDVEHKYTSELCHNRVMFAWTRKPKDIIWGDYVEDEILKIAKIFGRKYSANMPLIIDAEMRIKLARLSISIAIMTYSVDETGEKVIVKKSHVSIAAKWINEQYENTVSGYLDYSEQIKINSTLADDSTHKLDGHFRKIDLINTFLTIQQFSKHDIGDICDYDLDDSRRFTSELLASRAIQRRNGHYVKTSQFINYLKERRTKLRNGDEVF